MITRAKSSVLIAFLFCVGCGGGFKANTTSGALSSASALTDSPESSHGPDPAPSPAPAPAPAPPTTPLPSDPVPEPTTGYKDDILSKVGLNLGPRGNSSCQLQPPTIPAFDQASDGPDVLKVCQEATCPYQTISAAVAVAAAGSVIAIKAGTYNECVRVTKDNITLQGRGGRPVIQASNCPRAPYAGAIIGVRANDAKIENLELTDPTGDSVIAVGSEIGGANITLRNLYIHHVQGGLYTVVAGDIVVTNSYFDHTGHMNGTDPHTAAAIGGALRSRSFTVNNVTITHPKQSGGMLAGAAYKNTVNCVVAADLEGGLSPYLVSFSYGYGVTITNSVLQRGPLSQPQMLLYWNRATEPVQDRFVATNNILISDQPTRVRPMLNYSSAQNEPTTISDNIFIGPGSTEYSDFPNSLAFESRAAAGIGQDVNMLPYPGSR